MRLRLLPSSFEPDGSPSARQHTTCFIIDDKVAIDAGSLGQAAGPLERRQIRDVILTHAHLDHICGLPFFLDDLFATLREPITVHASPEVIDILERDVFNWSVYPRFSELRNEFGEVLRYSPLKMLERSQIAHLDVTPMTVDHKVPTQGFLIRSGSRKIAITGDTASLGDVWSTVASEQRLDGLFVECAFPDEMADLAEVSHHLTPSKMAAELEQFDGTDCPIYVINIKPMYRERVIEQLGRLEIPRLRVLEVGREIVL